MAAGSGAVNPGADFSPAQAQKQWLAGWKVVKSVLDALLANLSLTPDCCAYLYVMYGYDCSVPEAVMRMSSVLSVQAVTVSWADLDNDNQTADHHLKIANCVKRGSRQVMKKLLWEKTFILDGYQKADAMSEETPRPTDTESAYTQTSVQWPVDTCRSEPGGWSCTARNTQRRTSRSSSRP